MSEYVARKQFKKDERIQVWEKYDKHCAYCGVELEYNDMQVDHMVPVSMQHFKAQDNGFELNGFSNLMPSCRSCNYYKSSNGLEDFRKQISQVSRRLLSGSAKFLVNLAVRYGVIELKEFDHLFYFERIEDVR